MLNRVVMLTPDIMIDRRIILEADSLIKEGKEVILIAGNDGTYPEYEFIGEIKVYRPLYQGADSRLMWMYKINNKFIHLIMKIKNKFIHILSVLMNKSISLLSKVLNKIPAILSKFLALITLKSGYEKFIEDKAAFFNADVIHVHDLPMLVSGVGAAKSNDSKLIYDSHELYTEEEMPAQYRILLKIKEKLFIGKPNSVITVNPYLKKELENSYDVSDIVVVENATIRPKGFDATKDHDLFRKEYHLPKESVLLLFQGWFASHRNIDTLIKGLQYLDDNVYLLLMGYGEYIEELLQLAKELNVEKRVIYVEAKSQEELLYYTASADIGLMPYLKTKNLNNLYSSPNKLYEFIASGLPILANDLPFYHDMIEKYDIGLVRNLEDPKTFADGVKEMIDGDILKYKNNCIKAYEKVNWDMEALKLIDIYRELEK